MTPLTVVENIRLLRELNESSQKEHSLFFNAMGGTKDCNSISFNFVPIPEATTTKPDPYALLADEISPKQMKRLAKFMQAVRDNQEVERRNDAQDSYADTG